MSDNLHREVLEMLIDRLGLEDIDVDSFDYDTLLFATEDEGGLGLDSVDVLEIVVGLKECFGVTLTDEDKDTMIFKSVNTLVDFIRSEME